MDFDKEKIVNVIKNDKKNVDGKVNFIALKDFGLPYETQLTLKELETQLTKFLGNIL